MRILAVIPHYYKATEGKKYSSTGSDPQQRAVGCTFCVMALHSLFGKHTGELHHARRVAVPVNQGNRHELDVVLCTTRGHHLLDQLPLPRHLYRHHAADVEPLQLEFECQVVLRDALGRYDYYCFLEDDLIVHDAWFFDKLAWFNRLAGPECLLQARRYEAGIGPLLLKLYVDGPMAPRVTERFQDVTDRPELTGCYLDVPLRFIRPLNPHAASYFLTQEQLAYWVSRPHFLDRDTSFIGPLESAATLGIMRTFRIYKAAPERADFLEIHHCDTKHLQSIGPLFALEQEPGSGPGLAIHPPRS